MIFNYLVIYATFYPHLPLRWWGWACSRSPLYTWEVARGGMCRLSGSRMIGTMEYGSQNRWCMSLEDQGRGSSRWPCSTRDNGWNGKGGEDAGRVKEERKD